jgi:VWFA-related protein
MLMREVSGVLAIGIAGVWVAAAAAGNQNQKPPTFRTSTELILIDTQVVARDGTPIQGLKADQFEVFIDGRRRPVVSAQFVRASSGPEAGSAAGTIGPDSVPAADGRTIVIAVDEASFPVVAQQSAREAVTRVVDRAAREDYVGLITFPGREELSPSRDRRAVRDAIGRITGARVDISKASRFSLSASDAAQLKARTPVAMAEIIARECRESPPNPTCRQELLEDASSIAVALEHQGMVSIDGLNRVLDLMQALPGRKTLIVVSAGLPMSSLPGGQPNFDAETSRIAKRAAAANVNLYVFYLNVHFLRFFSPAYGKRPTSIYEDITLFGYGLEKFADSGGGAFFQIEVDSDPFVDRALRETSASYLLAVQPEAAEHDGKEHFIRVAVKQRGLTVRYRRVVTIPRQAGR